MQYSSHTHMLCTYASKCKTLNIISGTSGGSQVTPSTEVWLKAAAGALGVAHDKLAIALTTHALIVNGQTSLKHLGHDESSNNTDTVK
jgi:hypothetical protein